MEEVIRIRGRRWRLVLADGMRSQYGVFGDCDHPSVKGKAIRVEPEQTEEQILDTLLHEYRHASNPDWTEDAVECDARDLRRALAALKRLKDRYEELKNEADACNQRPSLRTHGGPDSSTLAHEGDEVKGHDEA